MDFAEAFSALGATLLKMREAERDALNSAA